jgi:hypothetical protein
MEFCLKSSRIQQAKSIKPIYIIDYRSKNRDVAQFGSAPVLGTGGRRFESCHPDIYFYYLFFFYVLIFLSRGASPSGKAAGFDPAIRRFESSRSSL